MLEDVEITVDEKLYRDFCQLCAELGIMPEFCLKRMFSWMAEDPASATAYIREAAAEQRGAVEN